MTRIFTFTLLLATAIGIQSTNAQQFNKNKADSLFDVIAANNRAMISVAVTRNGQPVYNKAIGYSWVGAQNMPANTATKYRVGSVTKMFTAAMIFQLIEEGKLSLDTKLSSFYTSIPNSDKITIAQMLNHSSGIHSFTSDADQYRKWLGQQQTPVQLIARMAARSEFEPGSKHEYSNSNFVLLGYIIEKLDKRPYEASLKNRITGKLKLGSTYYGGKITSSANEANSYKWANNTWVPDTETDMSIPGGAGALVSNPTDLTAFMYALFTGKIVSIASLNQMRTIKDGFGMNLFKFQFDSHTAYGHTGGIDGFQSQAAYFPEEGIAVAYVANGVNTNINNIMIGLLSIIYNKPYQIPSFKIVTPKSQELDQYTGNYSSAELPLNILITKNNNILIAQATGQSAFDLQYVGSHEFKFEPADIVLIFNPSGSSMTLKQGGKSFPFTKNK